MLEDDGSKTYYGYDGEGRLTMVSYADAGTATGYEYDRRGNIVGRTYYANNEVVEEVTSEYDEDNRLLTMGDAEYEYDGSGNQLGVESIDESSFLSTYIGGEKMNFRMSIWSEGEPPEILASYSYSLDGRRVGKEIDPGQEIGPSPGLETTSWESDFRKVHYLYDGQNVVYEFGNKHPTVRYTHPLTCDGLVCGPTASAFVDAPISITVDGEKYYYLYDGLGSVTELIDEDENVVNRYRYTPFGESTLKIEEVFNPYQFTGRRYDKETGQYYYRARMYSPVQGRFLSQDPLGMVDGPNMYMYVRNDPVNARDPSGRWNPDWGAPMLINGWGGGREISTDYDSCPKAGYDSYWECVDYWTNIGTPPGYTSIAEACRYYCFGERKFQPQRGLNPDFQQCLQEQIESDVTYSGAIAALIFCSGYGIFSGILGLIKCLSGSVSITIIGFIILCHSRHGIFT